MNKLASFVSVLFFGAFLAASAYGAEMDKMEHAAAQVTITNPMPHAMNVEAEWGKEKKALGKVGPSETKTFDVAAPAGTEVKLVATDDAKTHSPSGMIKLDTAAPAKWTIQ